MQNLKLEARKLKAFSLVELSIVMIIIGILIVAVTQINSATDQASILSARSLTKSSSVSSIDGLELWLETTMDESFDQADADTGTAVTNWYDLSNNKYKAIQVTAANRPVYTSKAINGLPALYFDGSNDSIDLPIVADGSVYTIFAVVSFNNTGSGLPFMAKETTNLFGISSNNNNPITFSVNPNSGSATGWVNGTLNGSTPLSKAAVISGITTSTSSITYNLKFGRNMNDTISYFRGYICEVIIFKKALSEIERKDIEQYLGKKWGVIIN